jgi:MIP family channel proteins
MFKPKEILAELLGTFALVFVVASAAIVSGAGGGPVGNALAGGFVLAVVVYIFGSISGGHANPAVTFAMALNGRVQWLQAVYYWLAQFLGAILAAWFLNFVVTGLGGTIDGGAALGAMTSPSLSSQPNYIQTYMMAMVFEAILTFFLVSAYMQTVMSGKTEGVGGLVYGMAYSFAILAGGLFTGAALNPARSISMAIFASESVLGFKSYFFYVIYVIGPLFGATLAVLAYNYFHGIMDIEDDEEDEEVEVAEEAEKA